MDERCDVSTFDITVPNVELSESLQVKNIVGDSMKIFSSRFPNRDNDEIEPERKMFLTIIR